MYVELHCHSAFSFLDGTSDPSELAATAAELGYPALALTDHDGLWGNMEFAQACKGFGVRPITGAEVTVTARPRVLSRGARFPPVLHGPRGAETGPPAPPAEATMAVLLDFGHAQ
jgi:DNA polymerase III alpha subunit